MGVYHFLNRRFNLVGLGKYHTAVDDEVNLMARHKTIKKATDVDMNRANFNTVVASLMEFVKSSLCAYKPLRLTSGTR